MLFLRKMTEIRCELKFDSCNLVPEITGKRAFSWMGRCT